jgi:hypothetical protein
MSHSFCSNDAARKRLAQMGEIDRLFCDWSPDGYITLDTTPTWQTVKTYY